MNPWIRYSFDLTRSPWSSRKGRSAARGVRPQTKKVKKVKMLWNFNHDFEFFCTFFAPCFEVFLHFIIYHKIDNQHVKCRKITQTENF
jgi:hypothetical protein